jgi:hypothetical protein
MRDLNYTPNSTPIFAQVGDDVAVGNGSFDQTLDRAHRYLSVSSNNGSIRNRAISQSIRDSRVRPVGERPIAVMSRQLRRALAKAVDDAQGDCTAPTPLIISFAASASLGTCTEADILLSALTAVQLSAFI